jgi:LemA protein
MDISGSFIGGGVAAVLLLWLAIHLYNRLLLLRNRVRNAWADVDVQLSLRHDLVPNLVESVKGYVTHERETLSAVTQARTAAMRPGADPPSRAVAEAALGGAIGTLFAVVERYPELKASQSFLLLQEQLTTIENRIAFARQHYNDAVRQFNTLIAEFPWNLVSRTLGFAPAKMFSAEAEDRANVHWAA